jgi:23S rRNA pseudouridine2605 synthase
VQPNGNRKVGLARAISKLGHCSRSRAAELIREGRVRLNGAVRRDAETPVRLGRDTILVDDHRVDAENKIYLVMNKPRGLVTTASDEKGRDTVYSVLQETGNQLPWLAPVGRLDKASEGLLLMTNDSEWAGRIASPHSHLNKTYHVQIGTLADDEMIQAMVHGVKTQEGEVLRTSAVRVLRSGKNNCWLEIILDEGRNRQIRRILESLGVEVLRVMRVAIGPLKLGQLPKGTYRRLTMDEKKHIDRVLSSANSGEKHPQNEGRTASAKGRYDLR